MGVTNRIERLSEEHFAYLMLLPSFVFISVLALWPLSRTFRISLQADSPRQYVGGFVGFDNYIDLLTGERQYLLVRPFFDADQLFTSSLSVTVLITVVSVALMVILALGQAIILNKEFRLRSAARIAVLFPWALPLVIYGMIFFLLFQPNFGFGVPLMEQFGLSDIPLTEPAESSLIIIIAYGIRGSPFIALIVLAGMQNIDPSLYNVAKVSGATRWQQFKTVTLPLAYPALLVGVLFSAIAVMKLFALPVTLTGGCTTVPSLSCLVLETFEGQFYGTAAALSFITAIVIGILVVLYLFYSQRRVNL